MAKVTALHRRDLGFKRTWKVVTGGSTFCRIFAVASITEKNICDNTTSRIPVFL
jgi:hypothetical protein